MRPQLAHAAVLLALATVVGVLQAVVIPSAAPKMCQTPECLALSALITSNMNQSADPCEDFNEYACGHFRTNNFYDPASLSWSERDEPLILLTGLNSIQKKLTNRLFELLYFPRPIRGEDPDLSVMHRLASGFTRSCTAFFRKLNNNRGPSNNQDTLELFFQGILNHLVQSMEGVGWGVKSDWFERALAKMVRYEVWPMLKVSATFRLRYQLAKNGTVDSKTPRVALNYETGDSAISNASVTHYTNFFKSLSAGFKFDFDKPLEFLNIVHEITQNVTTETKKTCAIQEYDKKDLTIRELDALSKCLNPESPFLWSSFFEGFLDASIDKDTQIEVRTLSNAVGVNNLVTYFKKRSSLATSNKKFTAHFSFLVFDWLLSLAQSVLPVNLATLLGKAPTSDRRQSPPQYEGEDPINKCIELTKNLLGPVVERMFQKSYHEENFSHVVELIQLLQNATIKSVRVADWITPVSKDAIVDKIISLRTDVGFNVVPVSDLKKFYASTIRAFTKEENSASSRNFGTLLSFAVCALAGKSNNLLAGGDSASTFTILDTLTVNAFNYGRKNKIVFPMGILSPFLYHKSFPDYMNLGGLGVVIGHEIGHGFDDEGHELSKQGVRGHFWDNKTEQGYLERVNCVKSRFSSYELVPGKAHNPNTTVGNDIADLMGIRSGFGALQLLGERGRLVRLPNLPESLTPERLFFVQAAQAWCAKAEPTAILKMFKGSSHSPPHIRIRGMMEHSREFARVFQCRSGQAMNPRVKCEFW